MYSMYIAKDEWIGTLTRIYIYEIREFSQIMPPKGEGFEKINAR